jgi:Holliday junction resolvase
VDDQAEKHADLPPAIVMPEFDGLNAAHTIIEAAEDVRWNYDDKAKFIKRVRQIELGLSAEDEFSALLAWLGRCELVHRNGQRYLTSNKGRKWDIPDLFALFRQGADSFSAMIEVKTTKKGTLKFKFSYINGLREYSYLHSRPLLIAWRPRYFGFWLLFDPDHLKPVDDKLQIDFEEAYKNNLLGCVAGDFSIGQVEGAGLYFRMRRDGEKCPIDSGYSARYIIDEVGWRDGGGTPYERLPRSVKYALLTHAVDFESVDDPYITQAFVSGGGMVHAQDILRMIVTFWLRGNEPVRWSHVYQNRDLLPPRDELLTDLQGYYGSFIRCIIHQKPGRWPGFLPETWKTSIR